MQRTFIIIKPDAIERGLVGEIITRLERKGLSVVRMDLRRKKADWCAAHYDQFDLRKEEGREIFRRLQQAMIYQPLIGAVIEGEEAIQVVRQLVGATDSLQAAPGTIRGDFGTRPIHRNLIHAADSIANAAREEALFFATTTDWD